MFWLLVVTCVHADFHLVLLHTSDIRAQILPALSSAPCSLAQAIADAQATVNQTNVTQCIGGYARHVAYIDSVRADAAIDNRTVLLVNGGNYYMGSLFYSYFGTSISQRYFNRLQYDVTGVGVPDFYAGPQVFKTFLDGLQLNSNPPLAVSSNLEVTNDSVLLGEITPWTVVHRDGVEFGFVGVMDSGLFTKASPGPTVMVNNRIPGGSSVDHVRLAVADMQNAHPNCNIVILLSLATDHLVDQAIAESVFAVDLVVQANPIVRHVNGTPPYPEVWTNQLGKSIPVVSSGWMGKYIGHLNLLFDDDGNLLSWDGNTVYLDRTIAPDPNAWSDVLVAAQAVEAFKSQVVGTTIGEIDGRRGNLSLNEPGCLTSDCGGGLFVTQVMMWLCGNCDFALTNPYDIAGSFTAGNVTISDLLRVYPFQNTMVTFSLQGVEVVNALQRSFDFTLRTVNRPPSVSGLRYAYNPNETLPLNQRIVGVQVFQRGQWVALDPTKYYKMATNSYLRNGGDGYTMFATKGINYNDFYPTYAEFMTTYLSDHSPISVPTYEELRECAVVIPQLSLDNQSRILWPNNCTIILTQATENLLGKCSSNTEVCMSLNNTMQFSGFETLFTNTTCDACSGLGVCEAQVCYCNVPTAGLFAGDEMVRGPDCSDVRKQYKLSAGAQAVITVLSVLVIIIAIACSTCYVYYRKYKVVIRSSPTFNHIGDLGGVLMALAMLLSLAPSSAASCVSYSCLLVIGFVLLYGSLFVKTWRVYKLFVAPGILFKNLTDLQLGKRLGALLALESLLLIIFFSADPLYLRGVLLDGWEYASRCTSGTYTIFVIVMLILNGAMVLWGVVLAVLTRKVEGDFNESKLIGACTYNLFISCIIIIPVDAAFELQGSIEGALVLRAVLVDYAALFTMLVLCLPKVMTIRRGDGNKELHVFSQYQPDASRSENRPPKSEGDLQFRPVDDLKSMPPEQSLRAIRARLNKAREMANKVNAYVTYLEQETIEAERVAAAKAQHAAQSPEHAESSARDHTHLDSASSVQAPSVGEVELPEK